MDRKTNNRGSGTVIINDIDASSRDEMRCPVCGERSIEKHPSAAEYPNKKAKILKGSYCSNSSCKQQVLSPDEVSTQYSPSGIQDKIANPKYIGQVIVAIVGIILIGSYFFGGPIGEILFATPTTTVEGSITSPNGEPVSDASIELEGSDYTATTNQEGKYTIEEVEVGKYTLLIQPPDESDLRSFGMKVNVTQAGIQETEATSTPSNLYGLEEGVLLASLPQKVTVSEEFKSQNQTKTVTYIHPNNRENLSVTVSPLSEDEITTSIEESISIGQSKELLVQGSITDATATATGSVSTETYTQSQTTNSSGQSTVNIKGKLDPATTSITLDEDAGTVDRSKTINLESGEQQSIQVDGNVTENMSLKVRGGATDAPQQRSDIWSPSDGTIDFTIDEGDAPSTVTLTVKGDISTEETTSSGSLSSQTQKLTFSPDGSLDPSNSTISFTGGNVQSEQVGSDTLSGSAENKEKTLTTDLATVDEGGTYELEYNVNATKNPEYVIGGYSINGERTKLNGSGTENLSVNSGDTVGMYLRLEQEELQRANHTDDSSITVTNLEVSAKEIQPGEDIGVRATVENVGSKPDATDIVIYKDGNSQYTESVSLDSGEKQEIVTRVSFPEEGVHTVQANNSDTINITVGNGSIKYGEGNMSGTVNYIPESGIIGVDSNSDGTAECNVNASGGSCDISLTSGENTLSVTQNNISNTSYEISYVARYGAEDIKSDIDGDGTNEIDVDGVLQDESEKSASVTFPAGDHSINISTSNNESVPYVLEWTESGVVSNPRVFINGEQVIDVNESYQGEREFSINPERFESGENIVRLETDDSAQHTLLLDWSERGLDTYPSVSLASSDTQLCNNREFSNNNQCDIDVDKISTGTQTLEFNRGGIPVQDLGFTIEHTARSVPKSVKLSPESSNEEIVFSEADAQTINGNGSWEHTRDISITSGETYSVSSTTTTQLQLSGSVTINGTAERKQAINPTITLIHPDGTTSEFLISESNLSQDGQLNDSETITIPSSDFARGVNKLEFDSENDGVYNVTLVGIDDG